MAAAAKAKVAARSPRPTESSFEASTRVELERLGKADTMLGQQALLVARSMAAEKGSALVTLSKEHGRLMDALGYEPEATSPPAGAAPAPMGLDDIGRRRAEKEQRAREAAG